MNINDLITDDELEECIDGCSDIGMIRETINLTQEETSIDEESFADIFAYNISGFIDGDSDFEECNQNNWEWGVSIAENINDLVSRKLSS